VNIKPRNAIGFANELVDRPLFIIKFAVFGGESPSVMDLTAEFFLQTIDTVFVKHALPKGEMKRRAMPVDLSAIRRVGLLTVEGENDDISGMGQTLAARTIVCCSSSLA
jgi:poly(3-hydroxybutyrate) depolymerase